MCRKKKISVPSIFSFIEINFVTGKNICQGEKTVTQHNLCFGKLNEERGKYWYWYPALSVFENFMGKGGNTGTGTQHIRF